MLLPASSLEAPRGEVTAGEPGLPRELQSAQQSGEAGTWELTFTASPGG